MNPFAPGLLALLAAAPTIPAQIYADFTVSHGDTPLGTFRVRLDHDKAPRPVAAFIGLATGQRNWVDLNSGSVMSNTPYYDGQIFHRLDHDFVLQGGDQLGTGGGGPGYVFQDQYHADLRHDRYILSMAKTSDPNTNGSQFFIVLADESAPTSFASAVALDDLHSVFGEVINDATYPNSRTLIDNFADPALFPTNGERPQTPINLDSVVISGPSLATFDINDPALLLPTVRRSTFTPSYDGSNRFAAIFPRKAQHEHILSAAISLPDLSPFRSILSIDEDPDYEFAITGVTFDTFFVGHTEVDYTLLTNAPDEIKNVGSSLTLRDHEGHTITLTFDGPDVETGTWSDSLGNSGTLSGVTWNDSAPAAGDFISGSSQAKYIPLGTLSVTFDSPAGHRGATTLNLRISFHSPTSGSVAGTNTLPDGKRLLQSFIYAP